MSLQAIEKEAQKIRDKISKIDSEISDLNTQKSHLENQLIGMETAIKVSVKHATYSKTHDLRPDSEVAQVRDILRKASQPMHIDDILKLLGKENDTKKKLSLVGSLTSYVNKNRIFTRTKPNTFALIETENHMENSEDIDKNEEI